MRRGAAFAQILDETLGAADADAHIPQARSFTPPRVLGFFDLRTPGRQPFASPRLQSFAPPAPPRAPRHLTVAEHRALRDLIDLGAHMGADFTLAELRAAFRRLAREYHPDRFPQATEEEKARLARLFSRAHGAYRVLKAAESARGGSLTRVATPVGFARRA